MRIGDFPIVQRAIAARASLISQRDQGSFGITIAGTYQDAEMVEATRPAIVAILNQRIAELDKDLEQLGVKIN